MTRQNRTNMIVVAGTLAVVIIVALLLSPALVRAGGNVMELAPGESIEIGCETFWFADPISDQRVMIYCAGDEVQLWPQAVDN